MQTLNTRVVAHKDANKNNKMINFMYLFVNFIFNLFVLFEPLQLQSQKNQVSTFVMFCLNSLHIIVLCAYRQKSQMSVLFFW